jgi:NAD(P)-dependent dehydrogenase (short-subunit alcohol dehydrogenase family)
MQLTSVQSIQQVFDRVQQDFGQLDVFVANSAHLGVGYSLLDSTEAEFDAVADVNIKGTFFCCQSAARLMKDAGGSIVTIGSVQGTGGLHGRAVYGMSKAALSMLVRYMAYELGQYHIRANNVVAGAVHSCRWDELSSEEIAARRSRYPVGRESTEEEIANAVWFLASDQSASITGTDLTVDSGLTACLLPYTKKE